MEVVFGLLRLRFALRRDHVNPGSFLPHQVGRTFGEGSAGEGSAGLPSVSGELRLYPDCRADSGLNLSKLCLPRRVPGCPPRCHGLQPEIPNAEYGSLFSVSCCFTLTLAR